MSPKRAPPEETPVLPGRFELETDLVPQGDQPTAIDEIVARLNRKEKYVTLLGVTGSGKTFTMAHAVQRLQRPTLVVSPNKTLAAQLVSEFRALFPGTRSSTSSATTITISLRRTFPRSTCTWRRTCRSMRRSTGFVIERPRRSSPAGTCLSWPR